MPRRIGMRDDDWMGRLHDIERRLDALEKPADEKPPKPPKPKD